MVGLGWVMKDGRMTMSGTTYCRTRVNSLKSRLDEYLKDADIQSCTSRAVVLHVQLEYYR